MLEGGTGPISLSFPRSSMTNCSSTTKSMIWSQRAPFSSHLWQVSQSCWSKANRRLSLVNISEEKHWWCCSGVQLNHCKLGFFSSRYSSRITAGPLYIMWNTVYPVNPLWGEEPYLVTSTNIKIASTCLSVRPLEPYGFLHMVQAASRRGTLNKCSLKFRCFS